MCAHPSPDIIANKKRISMPRNSQFVRIIGLELPFANSMQLMINLECALPLRLHGCADGQRHCLSLATKSRPTSFRAS
jgi:hypothetical protein